MSPDVLLVGLIGVVIGVVVGIRWLRMSQARGTYRDARVEVGRAKTAVKAARTAWMLATRAALLALVLLAVYTLATTTSVFTSQH